MGLKVTKRYSTYSFHPISAKLHDKYPGKTPTVTVLGDLLNTKTFMTL